jgi:cell shape-determining protein MreC
MIHMPHRSVTRFFIPLIDVLVLLFSVFLLMPVVGEDKGSEGDARANMSAEEMADTIESLKRELSRKSEELHRYENLQQPLQEIEKMRAELERLRKEKEQALKRSTFVRVLDIDGKTGKLSFFDPANLDNPTLPLNDEEAAKALIDRHKKEAGEHVLYYHFLMPRKATGFPTQKDEIKYKRWFAGVANSLKEKQP